MMFQDTRGGVLYDSSGYQNNARIVGSPTTQQGQVDGLPAWQFTEDDVLQITDNPSINTQALSVGISINFSFNPIATTLHGGKPRVICCKTDDSITARNYGFAIWVEPSGTLYFHVRVANTFKTASKQSAFISLNKWYRVACTFDRVTLEPRIYIDGTQSTETTSTYVGDIVLPSASTDLYIGGTDSTTSNRLSALVADWRYWREKVLTPEELQNLQNNSYSISAIQFVAREGSGSYITTEIWDSGATPPPDPGTPPDNPPPPPPTTSTLKSFTNTSFTSTSFAAA